jgi:hypothetical protein
LERDSGVKVFGSTIDALELDSFYQGLISQPANHANTAVNSTFAAKYATAIIILHCH